MKVLQTDFVVQFFWKETPAKDRKWVDPNAPVPDPTGAAGATAPGADTSAAPAAGAPAAGAPAVPAAGAHLRLESPQPCPSRTPAGPQVLPRDRHLPPAGPATPPG